MISVWPLFYWFGVKKNQIMFKTKWKLWVNCIRVCNSQINWCDWSRAGVSSAKISHWPWIVLSNFVIKNVVSLRHRKCFVRGYIHEPFVSKPERASEGFWHKQLVNMTPSKALSMTWTVYYTNHENFHWNSFVNVTHTLITKSKSQILRCKCKFNSNGKSRSTSLVLIVQNRNCTYKSLIKYDVTKDVGL